MSAPKMVTETDAVRRERAAFVAGAEWASSVIMPARVTRTTATEIAAREYPMPTVERPRTVEDPHEPDAEWRYYPALREFGVAHPDVRDGDFYSPESSRFQPTPARLEMWNDLLANPTEVVPADDAEGGAR